MWFLGAHCYMVSRTGAQKLLDMSKTFDMHVDFMMTMAMNLGVLRGFTLPTSLAGTQCNNVQSEQSIPHHTIIQENYKRYLPDLSLRACLVLLLFILLLLLFYIRSPPQCRTSSSMLFGAVSFEHGTSKDSKCNDNVSIHAQGFVQLVPVRTCDTKQLRTTTDVLRICAHRAAWKAAADGDSNRLFRIRERNTAIKYVSPHVEALLGSDEIIKRNHLV